VAIDVNAFAAAYRQAVDDVMRFITPEHQVLMARHNPDLHPDSYDIRNYLALSEKRYVPAVEMINRHHRGDARPTVLDVGGFLASFPLALARVGVPTTLSEKYGYYYGAFDDLRDYLVDNGVSVLDLDLTDPGETLPSQQFDVVTNMAMIEHLAHGPKDLLENIHKLVADDGHFVIEVPNITYWPTRINFLRGRSVHPHVRFVYRSETPFMGHHREYTRDEVADVLDWSGYDVSELITLNYSWDYHADPVRNVFYKVVYEWPMRRYEANRELIMACAKKKSRP
jgi:SAM-dependent methyltransferase